MTENKKSQPSDAQQMATVEPHAMSMLAVLERAARDPNVDVDKLERLMLMKERMDAQHAKTAYDAAMAEMQPHLPVVAERGSAAGRYTYALWEDINTLIKPVLQTYGFALTFRTNFTDGISVTGVLSHRDGHREETTISLPPDPSGNKPAVQAVASSVSYGKRYTASALLNLTSHGEDDDAYRAAVEMINEEQELQLTEMLEATNSDVSKFLKWLKVDALSSIPVKRFEEALAQLKRKEQRK